VHKAENKILKVGNIEYMKVYIENSQTKYELNEETKNIIQRTVQECVAEEHFDKNCEISIIIVDNNEIKKLNKKYRGKNCPTDVLSFPILDIVNGAYTLKQEDYDRDENIILLGDIIISMEMVVKQAAEYGHSVDREIAFLVSHGVYHLLGYDHKDKETEKRMFEKQEKVLMKLGLKKYI